MRVVVGMAAALMLVLGSPSSASADAASDEQTFFDMTNSTRASNGLPAFAFDRAASDLVARPWSAHMASTGRLAHNPDYVAQISERVTNSWTRLGENVGYGGSASSIQNAFMASAGHRANILGDYNRIGIGVTRTGNGTVWVTVQFIKGPAISGQAPTASSGRAGGGTAVGMSSDAAHTGYVVVRADGSVANFGGVAHRGDLDGKALTQPIKGITVTPDGGGYWLVASDGGIFAFGNAAYVGSTGAMRLNRPIVGMASTPSGRGYWLVASDGGIFAFGDAAYVGSTGAQTLNRPIVGMSSSPSGRGYWLVASDGGIFAFGDAAFVGSTGAQTLNRPIVGMSSSPSGRGYWLVASDGGIFAFGDAPFVGSTGGSKLNSDILSMTSSGNGYWLVAGDGGIFAFNAPFLGSAA